MKRLSVVFSALASILLVIIILFTMVQLVINNEVFINNEFTKHQVASTMGMSNGDVVKSTMRLIQYMEGDVDSIDVIVTIGGEKVQMFALEQEHTHMEDVRQLYQWFRTARDFSILAVLILFLFSAITGFRDVPRSLARGFLYGSFVVALVFGFVGTWAALDFSSFWTFFHQMLFTNDEWLFDPTTSRMINMLPEALFADIVGRVALYAAIAWGALTGVSIVTLITQNRRRRKAREAAIAAKRKKARAAEKKALAERAASAQKKPEPEAGNDGE